MYRKIYSHANSIRVDDDDDMVRWVCNSRDPVLGARALLRPNVFSKI